METENRIANADEVEITEEMIEAGAEIIWGMFSGDEMYTGSPMAYVAAKGVYSAMVIAAKKHDLIQRCDRAK